MTTRKRGHIVMIGSVSGISLSVATSLYNATKFGLRGFTLGFRQDLAGSGVGISLVEPGFIRDVGMFVESGGVLPKGVRTSSPEQVARGVVNAILKDKAETVVAPIEIRAGAKFGSVCSPPSTRGSRSSAAARRSPRRSSTASATSVRPSRPSPVGCRSALPTGIRPR